MKEKNQKDILKSILVGMMPKYALVKIPKVFSPELNSIVDTMVDEIYELMKKDTSGKDYLLNVVGLNWPYYFNEINKQLYILNKNKGITKNVKNENHN